MHYDHYILIRESLEKGAGDGDIRNLGGQDTPFVQRDQRSEISVAISPPIWPR